MPRTTSLKTMEKLSTATANSMILPTIVRRCQEGYREEDRGFDSPCWIWKTGRNRATILIGDKIHYVYRLCYEFEYGPVPQEADIHHLCEEPSCVNPAHLRVVTSTEHDLSHRSIPQGAPVDYEAAMEKLSTATKRLGVTPTRGRALCGVGRWPGAGLRKDVNPRGEWWVPVGSKPTLTKPASRLTDGERDELARRRLAGEKLSVLAKEFKVTDGYVSRLATNLQKREEKSPSTP